MELLCDVLIIGSLPTVSWVKDVLAWMRFAWRISTIWALPCFPFVVLLQLLLLSSTTLRQMNRSARVYQWCFCLFVSLQQPVDVTWWRGDGQQRCSPSFLSRGSGDCFPILSFSLLRNWGEMGSNGSNLSAEPIEWSRLSSLTPFAIAEWKFYV